MKIKTSRHLVSVLRLALGLASWHGSPAFGGELPSSGQQFQTPPALAQAQPRPPVMAKTAQTPGQAESQLIKDARKYQSELHSLATNAQKIASAMPERPEAIRTNLLAFRATLTAAQTNLLLLLSCKRSIIEDGNKVLSDMADVGKKFDALAKLVADTMEQRRRADTNDQQAVEAAATALEGIRQANLQGKAAVAPLRESIMADRREAEAVFSELAQYPEVFDFAIQTCDLYITGIGDPASYDSVLQGLLQARDNLRAIIQSFLKAAEKADDAILKMPKAIGSPVS